MTIPRDLGPGTGTRAVLPDFRRGRATLERMIAQLNGETGVRTGRTAPSVGHAAVRPISGGAVPRTVYPEQALRDVLMRAVAAGASLCGALAMGAAFVMLGLALPDGPAAGAGLLLVMLPLALAAAVCALLGLRFALVAVASARARVEVSEEGLRVVGAVRTWDVAWREIRSVRSRALHPVHWLTADLQLHDGSRVVMPAFDRHLWAYGRPSGTDLRTLRREVRRRRRARP